MIPCYDHSCVFKTAQGGVGTNGGCHCLYELGVSPSFVEARVRGEIAKMRAAYRTKIAELEAEIKRLKART